MRKREQSIDVTTGINELRPYFGVHLILRMCGAPTCAYTAASKQ